MIQTDMIINFSEMPKEVQEELKSVDELHFEAFHCVQRIIGYRDLKPTCCISVTKRVPSGKYQAWSYGSNRLSWSGTSGKLWRL